MGQLEGRVAIVTGGASGIGAACVRILAREGAQLVVADIDEPGGLARAEEIDGGAGGAMFIRLDVTDEANWITAMEAVDRHFGRLDIMVANAGMCLMAETVSMSLADWRRQNALNLDGAFLSVKYAIPAMRRSGSGSIVMISSVAGLRGSAGFAGYCASKGGVRLFAKAVAMECCRAGDAIRVNTVHPGVIDTPLWDTLPLAGPDGKPKNAIDPHRMAKADAPLGRSGLADEVAAGVLFLASDASSYMTATELVIDGGITGGANPRRR